MPVHIRSGVATDVEAVLGFWEVATTEPSTTDDVESVTALIEHAPDSLVLAVDGGEIVGSVIVGWDGWRGALYRVAVAEHYRRRGLGAQLAAEAERRLAALGARRVHLIVAADEDGAQRFWAAVGFEPTAQTRFVKVLGGSGPQRRTGGR